MNSSAGNTNQRGTAFGSALLFVGIVVAVSLGIGYLSQPGEWYEKLAKPAFNPPPWVFGPVWTVLYILIAVAGWRIWRIAPRSSATMLWLAQMVLNWLWSPTFFGAEAPWLAFAIIVAMLACIVGFIAIARKYDCTSAGLFVPYAAWVTFATILNGSIAMLNS